MAYFANGTEGQMYEEEYCERCIHGDGCSVWMLHLMLNYDQHDEPKIAEMLNTLIPRKENGLGNEQCSMFVAKGGEGLIMYKCPHCGWLTERLRNRLIPHHPVRGYRDGMICPGSNQNPRNAESDKRPTWSEEVKQGIPEIAMDGKPFDEPTDNQEIERLELESRRGRS